jgi:putative pre-16S rRNA nuclease
MYFHYNFKMKVLALDYGRKRVGLAITDPLGVIAQPFLTLEFTSRRSLIERLKCIVEENGVGLVLVGHPISPRGEATKMSAEIGRFAELLAQAAGVEVRLWDERYTSRYADRKFQDHGMRLRKKDQDRVAASIMLEEYLLDPHRTTT